MRNVDWVLSEDEAQDLNEDEDQDPSRLTETMAALEGESFGVAFADEQSHSSGDRGVEIGCALMWNWKLATGILFVQVTISAPDTDTTDVIWKTFCASLPDDQVVSVCESNHFDMFFVAGNLKTRRSAVRWAAHMAHDVNKAAEESLSMIPRGTA
jgi:hypothetical protein